MIRATLIDELGICLGYWHFDVLPTVGDQVTFGNETFEVIAVEHRPRLSGLRISPRRKTAIRIRVRGVRTAYD